MPDAGASNEDREHYGDQTIRLFIGGTDYGYIPAQVTHVPQLNLDLFNMPTYIPDPLPWSVPSDVNNLMNEPDLSSQNSNADKMSWSYDINDISTNEVGGGVKISQNTVVATLKNAWPIALDASGEIALDRGLRGETITLPRNKVITSDALITYGKATKGISVLLDAMDAKEYGGQVFQEAKNHGFSDEDADRVAHRATINYLGWFKLPERGAQAGLGSLGPQGIAAGIVLGEAVDQKLQDRAKDYFMNEAIEGYKIDKENWQNFTTPDSSTYYERTR